MLEKKQAKSEMAGSSRELGQVASRLENKAIRREIGAYKPKALVLTRALKVGARHLASIVTVLTPATTPIATILGQSLALSN